MPVRKFNYTARRRIRQEDVDIVLQRREGEPVSFDVRLDLASYGFPATARVFVEAYRQTTVMRFPWGSVSVMAPPDARTLTEFDPDAHVLFRVKVTDTDARPGVLVAVADRLQPREADEQPDRRIPLLPPQPEELGQEIWRVEFESEPVLLVNRDLPDWKSTVRSDVFRALVYPAAMRMILTRILIEEEYSATDDPDAWQSRWLEFAARLPGAGPVPQAKEQQEIWIGEAVAAFARRFGMRTRFESSAEVRA